MAPFRLENTFSINAISIRMLIDLISLYDNHEILDFKNFFQPVCNTETKHRKFLITLKVIPWLK